MEHNGRKVYFPEIKSFDEIFATAAPYNYEQSKTMPELKVGFADKQLPKRGNGPMRNVSTYYVISQYCNVRGEGRNSLFVTARPEILDWLKANVLAIEYDRISFEVVIWDDGRALVLANHSKIIGSYWLAIIDAATVPTIEAAEATTKPAR